MSLRNPNKPYGHNKHVHFLDDLRPYRPSPRWSLLSHCLLKPFEPLKRLRSLIIVLAALFAIVFNQMLPGKCAQRLDPVVMFQDLHDIRILNQEHALFELQLAVRDAQHNNAIVLVGPPGVGKTLITRHIQQNLEQWQNCQSVNWDMLARYEADRYSALYKLLHEFGVCGLNLMIVDNLETYNYEIVEKVHQMVAASTTLGDRRIVFLYVFRLNPRENRHVYDRQWETLQFIPHAVTINFREFNEQELRDCIRHEAKANNMHLSRYQFEKIFKSIDVRRTGCNDVKRLLWEVAKSVDD